MELPVDAWFVWIGLAVASVAILGAVGSLPTRPPPDAAGVADTVDRLAAGDADATAEHSLDADAYRVGTRRLALRNDAGTARARFVFGPVTPVRGDGPLAAVLSGAPPSATFDSPSAFRRAVRRARTRDSAWRPAPESLVVRRVSWGGVDVTLVGA
jgi:hypothetical protein